MSSPKGWEKYGKKRKSLKKYDDGDTIISYKNTNSDLREKAVDERSTLEPHTGLIGELYGNKRQVDNFHDIHGYQLGKVSVVRIIKTISDEFGQTYHVQLKTPFYDFRGYEAGDGVEIGQFGEFGKAKALAVGFMRTVPTVTLADALVMDHHWDNWKKYLTEEQQKHVHFENPEDWRSEVFDNANINW